MQLFTRRTFLIFLVMLAGFALALFSMGRIPLCTCGFGLWASDPWSSENSQLFADAYSLSHVLHGVLFYWALLFAARKLPLRTRLLIAVLIEMAWELFENTPFVIERYRAATASLNYFGDSILNSVGDVLFTVVGFWLASRFSWKIILALFILIELLMLMTIRDNLTLNVLMLVYPVDAIREWQMVH